MATKVRKNAKFIMIIQILLLLLLDSYASSSNCNPDANREFLKSLRRGGKVLSGLNTVMGGIYGFAAKALDSSNDNMFKCFAETIKDAQEHHRLSVRTTDRHFHHQNMITLLIESNSILADCAVVREHYAPYHASNELSMEDEFRIACRQNNPESALIKFVKFVEQHDLFVALIQGTSHTDNLYSTTGISLLNETASCAVLAEKCRETLYPNWSDKKLSAKRNTTLARLAKIEEAFWKGRNALVTNYSTSARDDLHHMLLTEDFSPRNRQQAINEMHDFMTSKYPYRAWALIIFDEKDMWGNRISHEFFGKEEHQFIVNERELVLIAYSANRENHMCDLYRKKLHNRQLRQVLNGNYDKLTSYADNLIESIFVVKEWMEEHEALPAAEFGLIAVRYSVGLVCKRDSDHKHHHLEFIQNHRNGNQVEQVFLIGWC